MPGPRSILLLLLLLPALAARAQVERIDNARLQQELGEGTVLIDIRTPQEWRRTGVVPGSHLLTFFDEKGRYDGDAWLARLAELATPQQPVALICHSGVRSAVVGRFLTMRAGYGTVYDVTGGIVKWKHDGQPVLDAGRRPVGSAQAASPAPAIQ
jgi:rhodanese-related sulfurtransferase